MEFLKRLLPKPHIRVDEPSEKKRKALILFLGLLLILIQPITTIWVHTENLWAHLGFEVSRDIGIALVVAVVVAHIFEFYERTLQTVETMDRLIDMRMADQLGTAIWDEMKKVLRGKQVIRRNAGIRIKARRHTELPNYLALISLEFGYDLCSLQDEEVNFIVVHELDYQFSAPEINVPCFERVMVHGVKGIEVYEGNTLARICDGKALKLSVTLPSRDEGHTRIIAERQELVPAPGSFNLYMTEFTRSLTLQMDETLEDVDVEVRVRPEGPGQTVEKSGKYWVCESLLLPGQGVEIKFISRGTPSLPLHPAKTV
jgi:hypothetical protein